MQRIDRHDILADPTRRALLEVLAEADGPVDVRALAALVGRHPNSVREQLGRLVDAGMVRVAVATPSGRGRPGLRYRLSTSAGDLGEPWRLMGTALADELLRVPGATGIWTAAGERLGRAAIADAGEGGGSVTETLAALMAEAGFAPEHAAPSDTELRLRACPFLPLDARLLPVVCGMHLGYIRGALGELGAPTDGTSIEPLVTPDLCVAHLASAPQPGVPAHG